MKTKRRARALGDAIRIPTTKRKSKGTEEKGSGQNTKERRASSNERWKAASTHGDGMTKDRRKSHTIPRERNNLKKKKKKRVHCRYDTDLIISLPYTEIDLTLRG